ncbi:hypothetical protein MSAN_02466500 [Mycena sanguinolenta]|uniref:Uncharacterized protein n=1 Tax=Mycena sanguinolenta TaxID=230812 RepID=A0A8H7CAD2_9AGAR|nr:hypothetical protein MSAN_02466500 [Mycena sanguinolenta]
MRCVIPVLPIPDLRLPSSPIRARSRIRTRAANALDYHSPRPPRRRQEHAGDERSDFQDNIVSSAARIATRVPAPREIERPRRGGRGCDGRSHVEPYVVQQQMHGRARGAARTIWKSQPHLVVWTDVHARDLEIVTIVLVLRSSTSRLSSSAHAPTNANAPYHSTADSNERTPARVHHRAAHLLDFCSDATPYTSLANDLGAGGHIDFDTPTCRNRRGIAVPT